MKVLIEGHKYALRHLDGDQETIIQFVSRPPHEPIEGITNQELIRALIDRVKFLHREKPWSRNAEIIYHLRMALTLHELRALELHVINGELEPEKIVTGPDGHFKLDIQ